MSKPLPWERQRGETTQAYAAFAIYRGLPATERSRDVAYRLSRGMSPDAKTRASGKWSRWQGEHNWVERARLYDDHIEREARKGEERSQIRKLREFRVSQLRNSNTAARQALRALQKAGEKLTHLQGTDLKPNEAASLMQAAARLLESAASQQASALAVDEMLEALSDG